VRDSDDLVWKGAVVVVVISCWLATSGRMENTTSEQNGTSTESMEKPKDPQDDLVIIIVVLTFIFLIILALYVWSNRRLFGFEAPAYVFSLDD
jgi:hypothetical protein